MTSHGDYVYLPLLDAYGDFIQPCDDERNKPLPFRKN